MIKYHSSLLIHYITQVWNDYQLIWDEADYGGIGVLRLPPDKVWKPDIVLFNNADGNYEVRYKSNVLIYPHGEVLWVPPAIYQVNKTNDSVESDFYRKHILKVWKKRKL